MILFHVQHFLGIGHLIRAFALAEALAQNFRVVVVSGGRFPPGIDVPGSIELVGLPALGFDRDRMLVSLEPGRSVDEVVTDRQHRLLSIYDRVSPDVVLVELFPFGRKKLAPELIPLLERARADVRRPLTVTSVRDLLVTGRHDQQRHDDRAARVATELIDLVLVHGDPRFATLDESFRPTIGFPVPVAYTGYVAGHERPIGRPVVEPGSVVVSAGGGWVGDALMTAALDAAPLIAERHGLTTTLIPGPLADGSRRERLRQRSRHEPSVTVVDSVPGLLPTLRQAAVSVSQVGYNTTVDLLRANVPAVLVPFGDERENEQRRRAERLARHGAGRLLSPENLNRRSLAGAVADALSQPPPAVDWSLDGAEVTARLISEAFNTVKAS